MLHIAFRIALALFLSWLGLCALLFIGLGVAMLLGNLSAAKAAQDILDEADHLHSPSVPRKQRPTPF
jgi:hypothetical protein